MACPPGLTLHQGQQGVSRRCPIQAWMAANGSFGAGTSTASMHDAVVEARRSRRSLRHRRGCVEIFSAGLARSSLTSPPQPEHCCGLLPSFSFSAPRANAPPGPRLASPTRGCSPAVRHFVWRSPAGLSRLWTTLNRFTHRHSVGGAVAAAPGPCLPRCRLVRRLVGSSGARFARQLCNGRRSCVPEVWPSG